MLSVLVACAENSVIYPLDPQTSVENRRLLVTFSDQSINRTINGNAQDNYKSPAQYLNSSWSHRQASALAERHHLKLITQWPMTELGLSCVVYEVADQEQLQSAINNLQHDTQVVSVQRMNSFKVLAEQPLSINNNDPYLTLQAGYRAMGIADLHAIATGRGVRIALIDSGVDIDHPDLQGQIKVAQNLAPETSDHDMADVHGTAVAGILSARPDNGIGIAGIAPEAEVYALRACWPDRPGSLAASCNSFTLALALNQAIRLDSRIINMSLTGPDDPLLRQLLEKALFKGIVVIAAIPAKEQAGGFPANMPGVIAVGKGDEISSAKIIAPGQDVLTTVPHQAYDFMTGSSFATPHVAGITALLLQLHPDWQLADIKPLLSAGINRISQQLLSTTSTTIAKHD